MAGIFQASLLLFLLQLIATTTTTTTSCEDWCRDNCDNCGEGENPCLYQRKCDSVCPCPQFNLVCLTSNVTLDLLEPRYGSVEISLYQNETKSATYELEDETVKTFVLNETSRPEEKMKVCLSHHRDHPVCRECTTSIPPAAAGMTDLYVILVPVLLVVLLLLAVLFVLGYVKWSRSKRYAVRDRQIEENKVPDSKLLGPLYQGASFPYIDSPLPDSERDD